MKTFIVLLPVLSQSLLCTSRAWGRLPQNTGEPHSDSEGENPETEQLQRRSVIDAFSKDSQTLWNPRPAKLWKDGERSPEKASASSDVKHVQRRLLSEAVQEGRTELANRDIPVTAVADLAVGTSGDVLEITTVGPAQTPGPPVKIPLSVIYRLLRSYRAFRAGKALQTYGVPIIVPVGLLGNTLSLKVMLLSKNRHVPCCIYMAALAVADNGMMLAATFGWIASEVLNRYQTVTSHYKSFLWHCKIYSYLTTLCSMTSIYLVILMTFNRFLAVVYPLKVKSISDVKTTKLSICLIVVCSLCYSVPSLLLAGILETGFCMALKVQSRFSQAWMWVHIFINSILPVASLLVMNARIIIALQTRGKFLNKSSSSGDKAIRSKSKSSQDNQLTMMLLMVSLTLLVLSLPQCVRYITGQLYDFEKTLVRFSNFYLLGHLTAKPYTANSAVNFFLYCIGGSRFRNDLWGILRCGAKKQESGSTASGSAIMMNTVTGRGIHNGQAA